MYVYAHMYLLYELNYRYISPHYECACGSAIYLIPAYILKIILQTKCCQSG